MPIEWRREKLMLTGHEIAGCPVKVQNSFDRSIEQPEFDIEVNADEEFSSDSQFKSQIFQTLIDQYPSNHVDLRPFRNETRQEQINRAIEATQDGIRIIIRPILPDDPEGNRCGSIDLLIRGGPENTTYKNKPFPVTYFPVLVVPHKVLEPCSTEFEPSTYLSFSDDFIHRPKPIDSLRVRGNREGDLLRLTHAWHLINTTGLYPQFLPPVGGLISTDDPQSTGSRLDVYWCDLSQKFLRTLATRAPEGWRRFSPFERYEHEFTFRKKVALTAADPKRRNMVKPIVVRECDSCHWWNVCRPQLDDDALSLRIEKSPLDAREITVLWDFGIVTTSDLANADLDELLPQYLPLVRHRPAAENRLRIAQRRSRMIEEGIFLERNTVGPIDLPKHELEIDVDVETSAEDRVYLWGFTITDSAKPESSWYKHFSKFENLDAEAEAELAAAASNWISNFISGRDVRLYHYSDYETVHARKIAKNNPNNAALQKGLELFENLGIDLFKIVQEHFFGVHGLGLKTVVTHATGFTWHDDEPSGLNAQYWFEDAVHASSPKAKQEMVDRVLTYNEDDTRATKALREWMRTLQ